MDTFTLLLHKTTVPQSQLSLQVVATGPFGGGAVSKLEKMHEKDTIMTFSVGLLNL